MSTLSQFFGSTSSTSTPSSILRIFATTGSMTIPSTACEVAYGVIGAGGASLYGCFCCTTARLGGAGGGFSYKDSLLSCGSDYTVCAVVGAAGGSTVGSPCGGNSCISGFSTGTICATGGQSTCGTASSTVYTHTGGCGIGGDINTCGGNSAASSSQVAAGGGAGGLFGNGGAGGFGGSTAGGGGMGSGGGGGAGSGNTTAGGKGGALGQDGSNSISSSTGGGNGGNGIAGLGGIFFFGLCTGIVLSAPQSGYTTSYTKRGNYSQAKTFLAAGGGGGAGGPYYGQNGAAGGGGGGGICGSGTIAGNGGFGGGGAAEPMCNMYIQGNGGIGGGGGGLSQPTTAALSFCSCGLGGSGLAIIEYWNAQ